MVYREATEKDLVQLSELRWDFEHEMNKLSSEISKEAFIKNCNNFLKDGLVKREWVYWIAEDSSKIISQIFIRRIRKVPKPQRLVDEYGYVTNVYTKPEYRNQGIGMKLMEKVKEWSIINDLEILIVWPSEKSVKFYERAGFSSINDVMELTLREDI